MDHKYIEEFDLVDRYTTGRLTADEAAEFEEHFVGCNKCSNELWTTEDFIDGLRGEQRYQTAMSSRFAGSRWIPPLPVSPRWASLAIAVLLIASIVSTAIFFNRMRLSRIEADHAKSELLQREQRLEEERRAASFADSKHEETEGELSAQLAKLEAELRIERKRESTRGVDQYETSQSPRVNLAILTLVPTRAIEPSSGATNELILSPTSNSFVLSIPLERKPSYQNYRFTIVDSQNRLITRARGLEPDRYNSLSVEFDSRKFSDGEYLLKLEGPSKDGSASVVGDYSFRIRRASQR